MENAECSKEKIFQKKGKTLTENEFKLAWNNKN